MVFCYKIITETPRRSGSISPRKTSPIDRLSNKPSSMSCFLNSLDYESSDILNSIPEHDWRLLAALARKREDDEERERLADQFRKMWQKEKEERDMVAAEISNQYNRYLHKKRQDERIWQEYKRLERTVEHQIRRGQLVNSIRDKEQRSADLLAWMDDKKVSDLVDKAIEEDARARLAADRRSRLNEAEGWRRRAELDEAERREDDARRRRSALLRDMSQRLAISNALSLWETWMVRQEVTAMEVAKRAEHAARAALTEARSTRLMRARASRQRRARRLAALTAHLREVVRNSGRT